jgi:Uma2 family endonuclease
MKNMTPAISHRVFEPGTTGWTVDDLSDPEIQLQWSEGRFELVDGVLTKMAPQGFEGVEPLDNLRRYIERHLDATIQGGNFYREVDLLLRRGRIARPDMLFLTREQLRRQRKLQKARKLKPGKYHPIYVTPYLVVESVSLLHEDHDRVTKLEWYAAAGIPFYWLLTGFDRSLICYELDGDRYVLESAGTDEEIVKTRAFGGVSIPLSKVWDDV